MSVRVSSSTLFVVPNVVTLDLVLQGHGQPLQRRPVQTGHGRQPLEGVRRQPVGPFTDQVQSGADLRRQQRIDARMRHRDVAAEVEAVEAATVPPASKSPPERTCALAPT